MLGDLQEARTLLEHYSELYGVAAIFVIIYLESFGAPFPGETAVVTAAVLAAAGDLSLAHLIAGTIAGAVLGDCTGYVIGRIGGRALLLRFGPRLGLTPARLAAVEKQFQRKGVYIVATARFVVVLRQLNGYIAGSVAMPWRKFLLANLAGATAWTLAWTLGPYFFAGLFTGEM
jgi:membrane protein DedA with SNARE-associated domain